MGTTFGELGRCPCGRPSTIRTWERELYLCSIHARAWLNSTEKAIAVEAIAADKPAEVERAVELFCTRIRKEAPIGLRVTSAIRRFFFGE